MIGKLRKRIQEFAYSRKIYPTLAAFATGLYPLLYYYNKNFTLVNSWYQFGMFLLTFVLIPIVGFNLMYYVGKKAGSETTAAKLITVANLSLFAFLIVLSTYGVQKKILLVVLLIALGLGIFLYRHLNKIVLFQLLLAALLSPKLIPDVVRHLTYSSVWTAQPDTIEQAVFKHKPNVYVIQPDGYPNFSELREAPYDFDNSDFETFLEENQFTLYSNFRSNYFSTLSSNSSMFSMKHHYYNRPKPGVNELYNSRDLIVGENKVVTIFKQNGYRTHLLLEKSYLLLNRPKIGFDYCNIKPDEVSFFARGFEISKPLHTDLAQAISSASDTPGFYFIEKIKPGHITTYKNQSLGREMERIHYLEELKEANSWLKKTLAIIQKKDPDALVVIVADHGGFVGMDYTLQCKQKQTDAKLIRSIFTSALAIKWPNNQAPEYDHALKSNVNLFRILFAYLSGNTSYLNHLQPDSSFVVIEEGAPFGVYQYITTDNEIVFNRYEN